MNIYSCLFYLFFLITQSATAAINYPGETIVDWPTVSPKGLVIIAPAKKYLMKERLFTNLAKNLSDSGFITVRFNWSAETLEIPELEIKRAASDIYKITRAAQAEFNLNATKTILITKSFSTKALASSLSLAKNHILITPNCSLEAPFNKTYQEILNRQDISMNIFISNEDPNCDVKQIHSTLGSLNRESQLHTGHGDHNFVIQGSNGQPNYAYQDQVINSVTTQILQDSPKQTYDSSNTCQIYSRRECEESSSYCWEGGHYVDRYYLSNASKTYGPYLSYQDAQNESYRSCNQ